MERKKRLKDKKGYYSPVVTPDSILDENGNSFADGINRKIEKLSTTPNQAIKAANEAADRANTAAKEAEQVNERVTDLALKVGDIVGGKQSIEPTIQKDGYTWSRDGSLGSNGAYATSTPLHLQKGDKISAEIGAAYCNVFTEVDESGDTFIRTLATSASTSSTTLIGYEYVADKEMFVAVSYRKGYIRNLSIDVFGEIAELKGRTTDLETSLSTAEKQIEESKTAIETLKNNTESKIDNTIKKSLYLVNDTKNASAFIRELYFEGIDKYEGKTIYLRTFRTNTNDVNKIDFTLSVDSSNPSVVLDKSEGVVQEKEVGGIVIKIILDNLSSFKNTYVGEKSASFDISKVTDLSYSTTLSLIANDKEIQSVKKGFDEFSTEIEDKVGGYMTEPAIEVGYDNYRYAGLNEPSLIENSGYEVSKPIKLKQYDKIVVSIGAANRTFTICKTDAEGNLVEGLTKSTAADSTELIEYSYYAEDECYVVLSYRKLYVRNAQIEHSLKTSVLDAKISLLKQENEDLVTFIGVPYLDTDINVTSSTFRIDNIFSKGAGKYAWTISWNPAEIVSMGVSSQDENGRFTKNIISNGRSIEYVYQGYVVYLRPEFAEGVASSMVHIKLGDVGEIPKVNEAYDRVVKNKEILIGAAFYAGWDGAALRGNFGSSSDLAYKNSNIYDSKYQDWREYVKAKYGETPSKSVTFAMYFAGKNVSYSVDGVSVNLSNKKSRKPIHLPLLSKAEYAVASQLQKFDWRISTKEQMQSQIDIASDYGIDYFDFCFVPYGDELIDDPEHSGMKKYKTISVFDENDEFIENADEILRASSMNTAFYKYLECGNKYKVKMSIFLTDSSKHLTNAKRLRKMIEYIYTTFIDDNADYLRIDGRPVVSLYNVDFLGYNTIRYRDIIYSCVNGYENNNVYGKRTWSVSPTSDCSFDELAERAMKANLGFPTGKFNIYVATCGWGVKIAEDFVGSGFDSALPSKEELYNLLVSIADDNCERSSNLLISIYAWNEFGEGGYLLPVEGDGQNTEGNYYNFSRLEAVREAKAVILSKLT